MKASVIDVHDMLSVLSVDEVERRVGEVPGVESETRLEVGDIKSAVRQRGYESAAPGAPKGHAASDEKPAKSADMAHEMGHVGGKDLSAMVRDMRNRFWICLAFSVPIFVYAPMGGMFAPPFVLSPTVAALSMSGSSAVVAINALLLKRTELAGITR